MQPIGCGTHILLMQTSPGGQLGMQPPWPGTQKPNTHDSFGGQSPDVLHMPLPGTQKPNWQRSPIGQSLSIMH
jgi:hypothetical protein